jgi:ribosomal-protein-alanine N-acetyltransferase
MDIHKFFSTFPIIELKHVTLREIKAEDADDFFTYINHPEVKKYLSDDDAPETLERAKNELSYWAKLFRYKHSIYWAIADKKTDKLIGTCGYNNWSRCHQRAEISYDLAFEYWGQGIMTEIIGTLCDFAFNNMDAIRIQATAATENIASLKVLEKNNFQKEGLLRQFGILHGIKKDFYMCSIIRNDYLLREENNVR